MRRVLLQIMPKQISPTQSVQISVDVQNTGDRAGDEMVQLYLRDVVASVASPLRELKGFKRTTLKPQEKKTLTFALTPEQLSLLDQNMKTVIELGEFEVMVGSSPEDIRLRGSFEVGAR
ncbi:fibronectin type III-like domain-contianing protein [candidate division KSB1 bacterium]|nr:fibronectin type III-like domain-contianing protein [candidate division KSB1 bacterium]